MTLLEGYKAYKTYLAIKQHFTTDYNFHKYNGKIRASEESFYKRRDRFFFRKLEKKYSKEELIMYFVSNFAKSTSKWIGNLLSQDSEKNYLEYKKNKESLSYSFKNELLFIKDKNLGNKLFEINDGHPPLFKFYLQGKVSIETLVILDNKLNFIKYWNNNIKDIVWESEFKKISKYRSFFEYNKDSFNNIIKEVFYD